MASKDGKLGLLIGIGPAKKPGANDGEDTPATLAAKGALQAMEDKDATALEDALRTFFDAVQSEKSG